MYLAHISWRQAERAFTDKELVALIPVGSTEQHGPVGPLGTDTIVPEFLAARIEAQCNVLVLPPMPYGAAAHHTSFPGTIDIGDTALHMVVSGIAAHLLKHDVKRLVFLNGHGGNTPALERAALTIHRQGGLAALIDWWSLAAMLNPAWRGGHGDGQEVAAVMAINENLVDLSSVFPTTVHHLSEQLVNLHLNLVQFRDAQIKIIRDVRSVADSGAFGGPKDSYQADKAWGEAMLDGVIRYIVDFIAEFKKIPL